MISILYENFRSPFILRIFHNSLIPLRSKYIGVIILLVELHLSKLAEFINFPDYVFFVHADTTEEATVISTSGSSANRELTKVTFYSSKWREFLMVHLRGTGDLQSMKINRKGRKVFKLEECWYSLFTEYYLNEWVIFKTVRDHLYRQHTYVAT